jgi:acetylornithine deacetylase
MTDVVALAAELLAIPSTTFDEGPIVAFVARRLIARGWNVSLQEVTSGRANIWATRAKGIVTLSTHLDTVPPYIAPRLENGWLFGRGTCDAKGIAAAMLAAADALVDAGEDRCDLLFVVGEEKASDGARLANQLPATSRFLINGEPTESVLASGAKGSLRVYVRTRGKAAHSAYPHLGQSALVPLMELLPQLDRLELPVDPVLGETTVNVGVVRVGTEANIVPAEGEVEMMIRLVGAREPVQRAIEEWASGRADIEYGSHIPPQRFHTLPGFRTAAVAYTTDIPLLSNWGTPLLFGPGSIHHAHTLDERVSVAELRAAVDTYVRLVRTLINE